VTPCDKLPPNRSVQLIIDERSFHMAANLAANPHTSGRRSQTWMESAVLHSAHEPASRPVGIPD
jgi:hypothetical protein